MNIKVFSHPNGSDRAVIVFDETYATVLSRAQAEDLFDKLGAWVQGDLTQEDIDQLLKG